ncbi:MAG: DUF3829 domain-containing protein [Desulfovibrio sp.]|nr:DUF3829 domain-containing protein [Desulfovibrio sp.]
MRKPLCLLLLCGLLLLALFFMMRPPHRAEHAPTPSTHKSISQTKPLEKEKEQEPAPPSAHEKAHAEQVLAFFNQIEGAIEAPWLTQADAIAFFIRIYLGEWELPKYTKIPAPQRLFFKTLLPDEALFSPSLRQSLQKHLEIMANALDTMQTTYQELERYVIDPHQDDGVKGKRLARTINAAYERFSSARKSYVGLLENEATQAENTLLIDFPLKRQILAARKLFSLQRQITDELAKNAIDTKALTHLFTTFNNEANEAAKPPFKESPLKERAYRHFLSHIQIYAKDVEQGINEGFFPDLRRKLNEDITKTRTSYNDFVRLLN